LVAEKKRFVRDSCFAHAFHWDVDRSILWVGKFLDPAGPPPGTPGDEQVVAITCSFSLFFHVKVLDSIL
jgi:hypothetical protein